MCIPPIVYLHYAVDGLCVQQVHFDRVLRNFPGMPEQSTFKYEAVFTTGQSRVAGPPAQRRKAATRLSGLFDLLFSVDRNKYVYNSLILELVPRCLVQ